MMHIVFFLVKGSAGYVIPRYDNLAYLEIKQGNHFGETDIGDATTMFGTHENPKFKHFNA